MTGRALYAYVGRQAIFDRALGVAGYELLYRDSDENRARFSDANQAAAQTMLNAIVELGLDALVGPVPAYVNLTAAFLLGQVPIPLPPERVVLEVLEDVPVTPALLAALDGLRARGYRLALDDFVLTEATAPLVAHADVVKLDVLGVARDEVARRFAQLRPRVPVLVAEKVSTPDELAELRALGFDRFQGFFLELPTIVRGRRLPHDRARLLHLLAKLQDPDVDLRALEQAIASDVGLVVRLLRLASSAALSRGAAIETVGQALGRLGIQQVTALVVLIMASGFDDKPLELARLALIRARMCEELARRAHLPADALFTAGLLSLVDAILDQPLADVLRALPLSPVVTDALVATASAGARVVGAARAQERGDTVALAATGFTADEITTAWLAAIRWADAIVALL